MKIGFRHILCLIYVILASVSLTGQTKADFDSILNLYELKCGECVALRDKVNAGEKVSRQDAKKLLDDFVAMNGQIKSMTEAMNYSQKNRFEAINRWFGTGQRPAMLSHEHLVAVAGTIPEPKVKTGMVTIQPGHLKEFSYHRLERKFTCAKVMVLGTVELPDASFGVRSGFVVQSKTKRTSWGGYVNFKSNFHFTEPAYMCNSDGIMENGFAVWPSGKTQKSCLKLTGGLLLGMNKWLHIYGGLGYGYSRLMWEDIDRQWLMVQDSSPAGIVCETGLIVSVRHITIGTGVSTIGFHNVSLDLSIGIDIPLRKNTSDHKRKDIPKVKD